tara:strand:+ start:41 stop:487 length:447 start_codon:yes stop_codon:yes gene_type:complete
MLNLIIWLFASMVSMILIGISLTFNNLDITLMYVFLFAGVLCFVVSQLAVLNIYRNQMLESKTRLRLLFEARKELNTKRKSFEHSKTNLNLAIELIEYMGKIARSENDVEQFPINLCDRIIGDLYYSDAESVKYLARDRQRLQYKNIN